VREALRLLEVQGLISLKPGPGGGPVVGSVDPAHLARTSSLYFHLGGATYESVLRTQAMFEPICAQLAALNPQRVQAMERFVSAPCARTVGEYRRHDAELRAAIHRLSGNPIISMLTQAINQIVADHVEVEPDAQQLERGALDEHVALARAVAAGESETAGRLMFKRLKAMHDHYRRTAPEVLDTLIEWR
jgi:DNA-binding FadR family transcriptional regulator